MPHSSGGGSHGGGSHGGSGSSGPRTYKSYQPGCRTFVYYRHGHPYYVYSDGDLTTSTGGKIFAAIIILFFIVAMGFVIFSTVTPPTKLEHTDGYNIIIDDKANIIDEDNAELLKALKDFKENTGITPALVTCNDTHWSRYNTLYNYGYDLYVNMFGDETHWLIVYSMPEGEDKFDWCWEAIQGNDTDNILTETKCNKYIEIIHQYLLQDSTYTDTQAFTKAFTEINATVMEGGFDISVIPLIVIEAFLAFILFSTLFQDQIRGYKNSDLKEVKNVDKETGKAKEKNCEYCGGLYVVGTHTSCPHCGASILAEDYDPENK